MVDVVVRLSITAILFLALERVVGEDVITLTGETFDATVLAHPLIVVEFYAPWCGHCKRLEPELEQAASVLKGRIAFAKVDATIEKQLADDYKVEGYPTLYFFRRGVPEEFAGGRDANSIIQWCQEQLGPALKILESQKQLEERLKERRYKVFFVAKGGKAVQDVMQKLAEKHTGLGTFFYLAQEDPVVEVHRGSHHIPELEQLTGAAATSDADRVLQFLQAEMLPKFGEIGEENYEPYLTRSGKGIIWACFHPDTVADDAYRHTAAFREVAVEFPDLPVVYTDTKEYEEHVKEELGCNDFPTLVVQLGNLTAGAEAKRYKRLLPDEFSSEVLISWVRAVLAGEVEEDEGLDDLDDPDDFDELGDDGDGAADGVGGTGDAPAAKTEL